MNLGILIPFLTGLGIVLISIFGFLALLKAFFTKVPQGTALIKTGMFTGGHPQVSFTGAFVFPVIHLKELMKISLVTLEIDRRGKEGLICKDDIRADITVRFYLRVNETTDDVLKVAKSVGVNRASDPTALSELFSAKFSEALKTAGKRFQLTDLFDKRIEFRNEIKTLIGEDLNGYSLEDVAIDYIEQTPVNYLDQHNIMDAEGIRKITEITKLRETETNRITRDADLAILKKDTDAKAATLALEREQAVAAAQQKREIESTQALEEAETIKVQEQQRENSEVAQIAAQETIEKRIQDQQREIEIAEQNRQRVVSIEIEKVTRARDLEIVARERDVELQRIEKEKALEAERKEIANIIRERVAVDKTVAQEEERIKEVRVVSEADRQKQVKILDAEAEAEQKRVREVKQALSDEESSKHKAIEISNMAQAELDAAAKQAEAKIRMAEGVEAERAAPGLADARVLEVTAAAKEKDGLAKAKVTAEQMIAEAKGQEEKGLAQARVLEATAAAKEKDGLAEALVKAELLLAQAKGEQEQGMAQARVLEATATAKEKDGLAEAKVLEEKLTAQARGTQAMGVAEASALLQRLTAEAEGLAKKFAAMDTLTDTSRGHEEFRMSLEKEFDQSIAAIAANKDIAKEQAEVLAAAMQNAKIELIGNGASGNEYYDKYVKGMSLGKSIEGIMGKSPMVKDLLSKLLTGGGKGDGEVVDTIKNLAASVAKPKGEAKPE